MAGGDDTGVEEHSEERNEGIHPEEHDDLLASHSSVF